MTEMLLAIFLALFVLPIVVFLCMKLGTIGYFKGRKYFSDNFDNMKKEKVNGEST